MAKAAIKCLLSDALQAYMATHHLHDDVISCLSRPVKVSTVKTALLQLSPDSKGDEDDSRSELPCMFKDHHLTNFLLLFINTFTSLIVDNYLDRFISRHALLKCTSIVVYK